MSEPLTPGEEVEVLAIWASARPAPLRDWFSGYSFRRMEGDNAIVVHTKGLYSGIEVRHPATNVRKAQKGKQHERD